MSVEKLAESLLKLNVTLRCCRMPLVPMPDGQFTCNDCKSIWKYDSGEWRNNVLTCCGNEIHVNHEDCPDDFAAFYCNSCHNPRQICSGGCMEMLHTKHNFYHHICHDCFCRQLEENE